MPNAIKKMYEYVRELSNNDPIDYDKLRDFLYEAAKEKDIEISKDTKEHKFHWLLESKRNTDEKFFKDTQNHLQSCDSVLNRSRSDDWWDTNTLKTLKKPEEESKFSPEKSPETKKEDNKKKKKSKKTGKPKRIGMNRMKNYQSQNNSFVTKNVGRL